jgi:hypothetical protein
MSTVHVKRTIEVELSEAYPDTFHIYVVYRSTDDGVNSVPILRFLSEDSAKRFARVADTKREQGIVYFVLKESVHV